MNKISNKLMEVFFTPVVLILLQMINVLSIMKDMVDGYFVGNLSKSMEYQREFGFVIFFLLLVVGFGILTTYIVFFIVNLFQNKEII